MNNYEIGERYFINICTKNPDKNKCYMILPSDIKRIIWRLIHLKPYIECFICNQIIMKLEYDTREELNTESIISINGYTKCISC